MHLGAWCRQKEWKHRVRWQCFTVRILWLTPSIVYKYTVCCTFKCSSVCNYLNNSCCYCVLFLFCTVISIVLFIVCKLCCHFSQNSFKKRYYYLNKVSCWNSKQIKEIKKKSSSASDHQTIQPLSWNNTATWFNFTMF